jgi:hypothetical protein
MKRHCIEKYASVLCRYFTVLKSKTKYLYWDLVGVMIYVPCKHDSFMDRALIF